MPYPGGWAFRLRDGPCGSRAGRCSIGSSHPLRGGRRRSWRLPSCLLLLRPSLTPVASFPREAVDPTSECNICNSPHVVRSSRITHLSLPPSPTMSVLHSVRLPGLLYPFLPGVSKARTRPLPFLACASHLPFLFGFCVRTRMSLHGLHLAFFPRHSRHGRPPHSTWPVVVGEFI